jgi:hypothetical protein
MNSGKKLILLLISAGCLINKNLRYKLHNRSEIFL